MSKLDLQDDHPEAPFTDALSDEALDRDQRFSTCGPGGCVRCQRMCYA